MSKNEKLKIIPLGGLGEVGKNMTAYEYGGDILIVDDAGRGKVILQFPRALTGQSKRWVNTWPRGSRPNE